MLHAKYMTRKELQDLLGVSRQTIYRWNADGMPHEKIHREMLFEWSEVKKWLEDNNKEVKTTWP